MKRPLVYIASPYTKGDPCMNSHFQCRVWDKLMDDGLCIPVAPLWSHFQHTLYPRDYRSWVDYDLDLIRAANFDACLRLDAELLEHDYLIGESSGADGEAALFYEMDKPVYYSVESFYEAIMSGVFK